MLTSSRRIVTQSVQHVRACWAPERARWRNRGRQRSGRRPSTSRHRCTSPRACPGEAAPAELRRVAASLDRDGLVEQGNTQCGVAAVGRACTQAALGVLLPPRRRG